MLRQVWLAHSLHKVQAMAVTPWGELWTGSTYGTIRAWACNAGSSGACARAWEGEGGRAVVARADICAKAASCGHLKAWFMQCTHRRTHRHTHTHIGTRIPTHAHTHRRTRTRTRAGGRPPPKALDVKRPGGVRPHAKLYCMACTASGQVVWSVGKSVLLLWDAYTGA